MILLSIYLLAICSLIKSCDYIQDIRTLELERYLDNANVILKGQLYYKSKGKDLQPTVSQLVYLSLIPSSLVTNIDTIDISSCKIYSASQLTPWIVGGELPRDINDNIILKFIASASDDNLANLQLIMDRYYDQRSLINTDANIYLERNNKLSDNNTYGFIDNKINNLESPFKIIKSSPKTSEFRDKTTDLNCTNSECTDYNLEDKHGKISEGANIDKTDPPIDGSEYLHYSTINEFDLRANEYDSPTNIPSLNFDNPFKSSLSQIPSKNMMLDMIKMQDLAKINKNTKNSNTAFTTNKDSNRIKIDMANFLTTSKGIRNQTNDKSNTALLKYLTTNNGNINNSLHTLSSTLDNKISTNDDYLDPLRYLVISFNEPKNFVDLEQFRNKPHNKVVDPIVKENSINISSDIANVISKNSINTKYTLPSSLANIQSINNKVPKELQKENLSKYISNTFENFSIDAPKFVSFDSDINVFT